MINDAYISLSPEYEQKFEAQYGTQPEYVPVSIIANFGVPRNIHNPRDFSRTWIQNPKFKGKRHKKGR